MTENLVYWAQALDNTSPDHIYLRGDELHPTDAGRRQEAVSLVSSVIKSGSRIFSDKGVLLTKDDDRFVLEVPSQQLDRVGRIAPIVCCGEYGANIDDSFVENVIAGIEKFTSDIERTIRPAEIETMKYAFAVLKIKSSTKRRVRVIGILTLSLVLLALVCLLVLRAS